MHTKRQTTTHRWWYATPPICALFYPWILKAFHASLKSGPAIPALILALAFAIPFTGFLVAWKLGRVAQPDDAQQLAKQLAWLTVAAPPIYTAAGVLLYMAGDPVADTTLWLALWSMLSLAGVSAAMRQPLTQVPQVPPSQAAMPSPRLRIAHGISAVAIVVLFLGMHLSNHLAGLLGEAQHRHVMDLFRVVYRARLVEPAIVALFMFQVLTGVAMLRIYGRRAADFYRSLQIASGAYLTFFILAHMNSVFLYARRFANIKTDWDFATGAPAGLLADAWNIRLVPHYYLGVFLVLAHLALGARIVALSHGVRRERADAWTTAGIGASALIALLIMMGMCGLHWPTQLPF